MFKNPLDRFRFIALIEGISFLLIGITMILKYKYDMPEPNKVVGMVHGVLFIIYVLLLMQVTYLYKWSFWKFSLGFIASLIPFGTFYADKKLFSIREEI
jgi:integral membrane protein